MDSLVRIVHNTLGQSTGTAHFIAHRKRSIFQRSVGVDIEICGIPIFQANR